MNDRKQTHYPSKKLNPRVGFILLLAAFLCLGADGKRAERMPSPELRESFRWDATQWSDTPLFSQDFFDSLPGSVTDMASDTLAEAIEHSRERALVSSRPMPERVRRALAPYFDPRILEKVRYTTDWSASDDLTLYRLVMANENVQAVTLHDIIVFREKRSVEDLFLWSHELKHVDQYDRWGVRRFASYYLTDHQRVEKEADDHAVFIYRKLLEQHYSLPPSKRPKPP
jgi:hypothetical protein